MKLKPLSLRKKFFFSYLLVYVMPFLLLGLMFYCMTYTALKDNSEKTYQNMLDNAVGYVENQVNQLSILTIQLSRLDWMNDIMDTPQSVPIGDRFDEDTLAAYRQQIEAYLDANSFIQDIVIYFSGRNYCIGSGGDGDIDWMLGQCLKIRDYSRTDWQNKLNSQNKSYLIPVANTGVNGQASSGLIYLQTITAEDSADGKIQATLVASIRRSVIENYLTSMADKNEFVAWITNKSGKVMFGENFMLGLKGFQPQAKNSLLFYSESPSLGLEFHAAAPKQVILKGAYAARDISLVVVALLGILGWFLSLKLAGRNYRPIEELMGFLKSRNNERVQDGGVPADEFAWLTATIKNMLKQEDSLKQRLERDRPSLMELYLIKLLEGNDPNDQEFMRGLELVGIGLPNRLFCCGMISAALEADEKGIMDAIGEEASQRQITHYRCNYRNAVVIIFNYNDAALFDSMVKNVNYRCNAMKKENAYVCFGSQGSRCAHIRRSYDEAAVAYEYRLTGSESCVILYDELSETDQCYYYPIGQENILTNHLRNGEYQKALSIFNGVIDNNLKQNLSPRALKHLFMDVELTVFKAAMDVGLGSLFKLDLRTINGFDSIQDMSEHIKDIMLCFCMAVGKMETRGHARKEGVLRYLDDNITNPMLSLNAISEHFKMSPSYFSRCFQDQFNCCFLDYVNARRIEISKELIAGSRSNISELSAAVGYGNDVTFRRIFKKYEGISPTQYKEMLKRKGQAI